MELYQISEIARELLNDDNYLIGRVIARPFEGESGAYKRTENRKDYAVETVYGYRFSTRW